MTDQLPTLILSTELTDLKLNSKGDAYYDMNSVFCVCNSSFLMLGHKLIFIIFMHYLSIEIANDMDDNNSHNIKSSSNH